MKLDFLATLVVHGLLCEPFGLGSKNFAGKSPRTQCSDICLAKTQTKPCKKRCRNLRSRMTQLLNFNKGQDQFSHVDGQTRDWFQAGSLRTCALQTVLRWTGVSFERNFFKPKPQPMPVVLVDAVFRCFECVASTHRLSAAIGLGCDP